MIHLGKLEDTNKRIFFTPTSGLDPAAGGLQVTTDGRRKVIDRIDASGAGDVDMSKTAEAKDGELKGATGRALRIPPDLPQAGQYRVGFKRAFSLYPRSLRDRWELNHSVKCNSTQKGGLLC